MLKNKKMLALTSAVILLPMLAGLVLWNRLPENIPVHWNIAGEVDRYGSRAMVVLGLFGFLLVIHWFGIFATVMDPKNKEQTEKALLLVYWIVPVLSLVMAVLTYSTALGAAVSVNTVLPVFLGLLFTVIGNQMPKCRRNYTIGIKIPWTLESEENWNATHRLAGKIWVIGGLLTIAVGLLAVPVWAVLAVLLVMGFLPIGYSYYWYKKHTAE